MIHAASVAVSREHRRAKTDRLDTELLKRAFLGWLRGERDHCKMVAIPTVAEEDARRPGRERESLVGEGTRIINRIETADTLVREVLTRNLRDRRAVARYGRLTGAPNQSGSFNREKKLWGGRRGDCIHRR